MQSYFRRRHSLALIGLLLVACVLALWRAWPARAEDQPETFAPADKGICLACHADKIDLKHFTGSAHGTVNCQDCHRGVDRYPHPKEAIAKKPACVMCHPRNAAWLKHSVHGVTPGPGKEPPTCQSCHGKNAHEIVKPESLSRPQQEASCRNCHPDKAAALAASIHGTNGATTAGGARPGCLACHGGNPHAIKPPIKTPSPAQNVPCQQCHAADTARMLNSAHGKAIQGNGNKPLACLSCHGQDPHSITAARQLTLADKNALCEKCHVDKAKLLHASAHGNVDMESSQRPQCVTCHGGSLHEVTLTSRMTPERVDAPCRACHSDIAEQLASSVHTHDGTTKAGKRFEGCLSCHGGGNPHAVATVSTLTRAQQEAPCLACHRDLSAHLADSVHNRPDKQPGDHPTCLTCHGGSPHKIQPPKHLTPIQKVQLCARCHADKARMARYGRTDAVEAYALTFHGRAILRFHQTAEATCTDCHGIHGILSSSDPRAPTTPQHAAMICGKCHKGNKMNFAFSYASHLRMNIETSIVTPLEQKILYVLVFIPYLWFAMLLILGISHVYCRRRDPSAATRVEDTFNVLGLLTLLVAATCTVTLLAMRQLSEPYPYWSLVSSLALFGITCLALLCRRIIFRCPVPK